MRGQSFLILELVSLKPSPPDHPAWRSLHHLHHLFHAFPIDRDRMNGIAHPGDIFQRLLMISENSIALLLS
jgi:hypothetical protein